MAVDPNLDLFVPEDGRLTSQNPYFGTLEGDELTWLVAPGNVAQGNTYKVTLSQLAAFFAGNASPIYEVTEGATVVAPYPIPADAGGVLFNVNTAENHYGVAPIAASVIYQNGILIKDLLGTADQFPITITFSGGETCDGLAQIQITTAYGWFYIAPNPGGTGWYMR